MLACIERRDGMLRVPMVRRSNKNHIDCGVIHEIVVVRGQNEIRAAEFLVIIQIFQMGCAKCDDLAAFTGAVGMQGDSSPAMWSEDGDIEMLYGNLCALNAESLRGQSGQEAAGFFQCVRAVVKNAGAMMNVGASDDLFLPLLPVIHFEPGVVVAGVGTGYRAAFAKPEAIATAVSVESCHGHRTVLEFELQSAGRHPGQNPWRACSRAGSITGIAQGKRSLKVPKKDRIVIIGVPDGQVGQK